MGIERAEPVDITVNRVLLDSPSWFLPLVLVSLFLDDANPAVHLHERIFDVFDTMDDILSSPRVISRSSGLLALDRALDT